MNIPESVSRETFSPIRKNISHEYIRGLITGEGCFSFCSVPNIDKSGNRIKVKIPTFALIMHERDTALVTAVRDYLKIDKKLYHYGPYRNDGVKRGGTIRLVIRDFGTLKNIIIPLFYDKLIGYKAEQFEIWLNKIGEDPDVAKGYELLYRLHKKGYFRENPKFVS